MEGFVHVYAGVPTTLGFAIAFVEGCDQQHTLAHTETHTPGWMNEGQSWLPHRAPIDDIITGDLVTPPFPCFREPFSLLQLHQGPFTSMTPVAYFLVIIQFTRLQSWQNIFFVTLMAQSTIGQFRTWTAHQSPNWRSLNDSFCYLQIDGICWKKHINPYSHCRLYHNDTLPIAGPIWYNKHNRDKGSLRHCL